MTHCIYPLRIGANLLPEDEIKRWTKKRPIVSIPFASGLTFFQKPIAAVNLKEIEVSIPFASGLTFFHK